MRWQPLIFGWVFTLLGGMAMGAINEHPENTDIAFLLPIAGMMTLLLALPQEKRFRPMPTRCVDCGWRAGNRCPVQQDWDLDEKCKERCAALSANAEGRA